MNARQVHRSQPTHMYRSRAAMAVPWEAHGLPRNLGHFRISWKGQERSRVKRLDDEVQFPQTHAHAHAHTRIISESRKPALDEILETGMVPKGSVWPAANMAHKSLNSAWTGG